MEKISIIIPAYNEEKRIKETLDSNLKFFKTLKKNKILNFEIIAVINGSSDKTIEIVKELAKKNNELKYLNLKRGAKGYAVIEGFKEALKSDSNLIGFKDADMATSPEAFYELVKKINNYDGIIASRYVKDSIIAPKPTFERIFASRIFNFMIRIILGLQFKDTQCGAKLFRREVLERNIHKIISSQWNFDVALLFCLRKESNAIIKSIPTQWSDKIGSKINVKSASTRMFLSAIRLRVMHSPFKSFLRIYWNLIPESWKIQ